MQIMNYSSRRTIGMEKIKQVIPKSIHAWGKKIERAYKERFVLMHWQEIVGDGIAFQVWPLAVEGTKLILYASAPAWRNEILLMQMMIIERVNLFAGYEMVKELTFSWQKSEVYRKKIQHNTKDTNEKEHNEYQEALQKICLTAKEQEECSKGLGKVFDERLRQKLLAIAKKRKIHEKVRRALGEKPCSHCGRLIKNNDSCIFCILKERKETGHLIRSFFLDRPWSRQQDIKKYIPCTPFMVHLERSRLVQDLARRIEFGDWDSLEAKTLVMLYRSLRPEQLTEEIVRRTLYDLRYELAEGAVFRPFLKRSEVMKKYKVRKISKK